MIEKATLGEAIYCIAPDMTQRRISVEENGLLNSPEIREPRRLRLLKALTGRVISAASASGKGA